MWYGASAGGCQPAPRVMHGAGQPTARRPNVGIGRAVRHRPWIAVRRHTPRGWTKPAPRGSRTLGLRTGRAIAQREHGRGSPRTGSHADARSRPRIELAQRWRTWRERGRPPIAASSGARRIGDGSPMRSGRHATWARAGAAARARTPRTPCGQPRHGGARRSAPGALRAADGAIGRAHTCAAHRPDPERRAIWIVAMAAGRGNEAGDRRWSSRHPPRRERAHPRVWIGPPTSVPDPAKPLSVHCSGGA